MKRTPLLIIAMLMALASCSKEESPTEDDTPQEEPSIPEKIEECLLTAAEKPWSDLTDTLNYYYENLLSKGIYKGVGPDKVYYELALQLPRIGAVTANFTVKDSLWLSATRDLLTDSIDLQTMDTDINISSASADSTDISLQNITVRAPLLFLATDFMEAPLYYDSQKVGWITRETFENLDYSTGTYIVVHYYNDPRTFALYENWNYDTFQWLFQQL